MAKDRPDGVRPSGWYHQHNERQQPQDFEGKQNSQDHHRHARYHNDVAQKHWTRGAPGVDP
jgi:hypothetical protein